MSKVAYEGIGAHYKDFPEENVMDTGVRDAETERERLIQRYIKDKRYSGFETQADGINHLAFVAKDLDATIEFYTQIVGLKLLRVRTLDGDSKSSMVFFDLNTGILQKMNYFGRHYKT